MKEPLVPKLAQPRSDDAEVVLAGGSKLLLNRSIHQMHVVRSSELRVLKLQCSEITQMRHCKRGHPNQCIVNNLELTIGSSRDVSSSKTLIH